MGDASFLRMRAMRNLFFSELNTVSGGHHHHHHHWTLDPHNFSVTGSGGHDSHEGILAGVVKGSIQHLKTEADPVTWYHAQKDTYKNAIHEFKSFMKHFF